MPSPTLCSRCHDPLELGDRFCRHCGAACEPVAAADYSFAHGLVDTLPMGIFTVDATGRIDGWNRTMELLTGSSRADTRGADFTTVLPQLTEHRLRVLEVLASGMPVRLDDVTHESPTGDPLVESFWFGRTAGDTADQLVGVMEDITQRVRIDHLLIRSERLAAIGELAAGVAHNFNNILAAIGGDAQLLEMIARDRALPPEVAISAAQIREETMRGGRIAHDLLSFARGAPPAIRRVDLIELLRDAARLVANHPAARNATVSIPDGAGLPRVEADPNLLHQVFFNLLLNAVQSMPQGGSIVVTAQARSHSQDPDRGLMDLSFRDAGVGIAAEELKRVFDPFYSRRATGGAGSGLGLPVSLAMVRSMGGDLQITSTPGSGTTVTITLPIVERRNTRRSRGVRHRGQVLLLDADIHSLRTLATLLIRRGFHVDTCVSPSEAVALAGSPGREYRLLLISPAGTPEELSLLREFQQRQPEACIAWMAPAGGRTHLEQSSAGASAIIPRSSDFSEQVTHVERLLSIRVGTDSLEGPYGAD